MLDLIKRSDDELAPGEKHPASRLALQYVAEELTRWPQHIEALSSVALSGNRTAKILLATLIRVAEGLPVGERYILGLAWHLRDAHDAEIRGK